MQAALTAGLRKNLEKLGVDAVFTALDDSTTDLKVWYYTELNPEAGEMAAQVNTQAHEIEYFFEDIGRELEQGESFSLNGEKLYYKAPVSGNELTRRVIVNADAS